jgi:hypothetical protein
MIKADKNLIPIPNYIYRKNIELDTPPPLLASRYTVSIHNSFWL